jgi:hypothetical protein
MKRKLLSLAALGMGFCLTAVPAASQPPAKEAREKEGRPAGERGNPPPPREGGERGRPEGERGNPPPPREGGERGRPEGDRGGPGGPGGPGGRPGGAPRFEIGQVLPPFVVEQLELTPEQQKQLDALQKDLKSKLDKLLTADQKKKLETMRPRGPREGGPGGPGGPGGDRGGPGGDRGGPPREGGERGPRPGGDRGVPQERGERPAEAPKKGGGGD